MAGSMLPILTFLISRRLIPMASISKPPTADIWETTSGNKRCLIKDAVIVMRP